MIFTLKSYNDLGRCSFGTLRDIFDTEKETIYDNDVVVKIEKIEDLFPYLWQSAGVAVHNGDTAVSHFHGAGTHWHWDFDESIVEHEKLIKRIQKRLEKAPNEQKRARYAAQLKDEQEHTKRLKEMLTRLDQEMEEQKQKLIEENKAGQNG
jgi:flagellar motility protein MotE (MotC chaperone)